MIANVEIRKERTSMELLEKVLSGDNIYEAYKKVYSNKGASGIDGVTVDELEEYLKYHLNEIREQIRNRKYKPSPVRRVYIPKDNGDKRALEFFNDGCDWVVDIDLEKFFDTVCHDKLISIIMKTVHDGDLVSLIRKYLVSGVMENGVVSPTKVGTPQGGNLSPLLSNIMLNELDKELDKRGLKFVRYADDCIIMVKSEKAANRVMDSIVKFIEKKLGLKVNATKSKVDRPRGIKYLGFGFYRNKTGVWKPKPHLKSIQKLKRKLKQLTKRSWSISLNDRIKLLNYVIRGWINYFRIADMKCAMDKVTGRLNRRIRCIIWKQWKTCKHRIECLQILGVDKDNAKACAYTRKSYWRSSKSIIIHKAISNDRLKQKGLVFPLDHYLKVHININ